MPEGAIRKKLFSQAKQVCYDFFINFNIVGKPFCIVLQNNRLAEQDYCFL